ncbi:hypothetical protein [Abiotrophia defectiva]|uniref:hypothetical protein n=1 Tax=Abiotrophia defectiva TaxID=46125 RepID=UPI0028D4C736|nr:hypothetical protein [Abiotrophia defectiva]
MEKQLSNDLSRWSILDGYVKKFLNIVEYSDAIESIEFSNTLVRKIEDILFLLDEDENDPQVLLDRLRRLIDNFIDNNLEHNYNRNENITEEQKELIKNLSLLVNNGKYFHKAEQKAEDRIRKCIEKVLTAISHYQNARTEKVDFSFAAVADRYPLTEKIRKNQVFLSHAYVDRLYTLGLFLYFYDKGIYLYIDWMHQAENMATKNLKEKLTKEIYQSSQILFLRTLNSELALHGGNKQVREWCAWEIGAFDFKDSGSGRFYIDRYRKSRPQKSKSKLIEDYKPLRSIQNGILL